MFFKRKEPKSKEKLVEKWCELNSILDIIKTQIII